MKRVVTSICTLMFIFSTECLSEVKYNRVELNWQMMRIRFFGESQNTGSLLETEKAAIADGVSYIVQALPGIRTSLLGINMLGEPEMSVKIAEGVARRTYERKVIYFSDGSVKVELESGLAKALAPQVNGLKKVHPTESASGNSSLIIKLDRAMDPRIVYTVRSDKGDPLYRIQDVVIDEFEKNFMGRFFDSKNPAGLNYFVGDKPVKISGSLRGDDTIIVNQANWDKAIKGNYLILEKAKVAIIYP